MAAIPKISPHHCKWCLTNSRRVFCTEGPTLTSELPTNQTELVPYASGPALRRQSEANKAEEPPRENE